MLPSHREQNLEINPLFEWRIMSRRKSSHKASQSGGFGRLLQITILLSIVFSAGLITGQRLLHKAAMPPLVSVQPPALSAAAERHLAASETENAENTDTASDAPARPRFSFYEKLSKPASDEARAPARRFITQKTEEPKAAPAPVAAAPEVAEKTEVTEITEKTEKPLANALAQAPENSDKKSPPALSAHASTDANARPAQLPARYTLQIGAYPSYERARQEMERLEKIGLEPHVIAAEIPGQGKFYRVRVGKFHSMDEARTFQADARDKNNLETFVTPL